MSTGNENASAQPDTSHTVTMPTTNMNSAGETGKKRSHFENSLVEPRLDTRPEQMYVVVAGVADKLEQAEEVGRKITEHRLAPVGYPAVDRADSMFGLQGKWAVVAGKYARKQYAQRLQTSMAVAGFDRVEIVESAYRHDRHRPNLAAGDGELAGSTFAGLPGMEIPLLSGPDVGSRGRGVLADRKLVIVLGHARDETGQLWYRVKDGERTGYLQASRLLLDHNVFPHAGGRHAVLGVYLGCSDDGCAWDYWLVDGGYTKRTLLAPSASRLPHDFSPDGTLLAYHAPNMPLRLISVHSGAEMTNLGPGTSPIWSSDGKIMYFRKPGRLNMRDEVMSATFPGGKIEMVLDFPGKPAYPEILSVYPPSVDILTRESLYTMFYRLEKDGTKKVLLRWKVRFRKDGRVIEKSAEKITE